ncbi:Inner membrane permease YgbN [Rubripirellula lacrimiformis]|uniref:Inner membrane permease YgbN n=1 Tax=Rubripirellula lacrimiformis TaxID=1930273 RepID=A0A517NE09_9BACT|nr:SLC13 family permease [Rubripirellula lacrimiformis]QDT05298.1 Inner membrane permease YgbN [Rubripirellula lacrimiformis]
MSIWVIVGLSVVVVLVCILVFRLHAFLTLLLAGLLVAFLAAGQPLDGFIEFQLSKGSFTPDEAAELLKQSPSSRLASAFGETAGKIGILIALASVVGGLLLESKAASVIVDRMLKWIGPRRAPEALAASAFVLAIPVFFDTVFYLMIPLARSLREKVGRDYVLFILAILAGGSIAHSLVPPTPGPLLVAGIIGVDIGTMMIAGLAIGLCSSVLSLLSARVINRLVVVPLRGADDSECPSEGSSGLEKAPGLEKASGLENTSNDESTGGPGGDPDQTNSANPSALPSLSASLLPILIPVVLIGVGSVATYLVKADRVETSWLTELLMNLGDKNIALGISVMLAFALLRYVPVASRKSLVGRSLASAGNIILITAAGGAFGAMLRQAGIEEAVGDLAGGVPGLMILPVAFLVTASIRTLQGSATVAMITAAGVLQGFASAESLPFHPVYLAMAIGAGSKPISWMTDSAFWVITRMSGMTESEGLKTISPMSTAMGISALVVTMIFAAVIPGI